jgi:hypothetical protein
MRRGASAVVACCAKRQHSSRLRHFKERKLLTRKLYAIVTILWLAGWGSVVWAQDCNGNLIPDECDVDCGPPGGYCDVEGCGLSADCNANGIPDECELLQAALVEAQDYCAYAMPVGPGPVYSGLTFGATVDGGSGCGGALSPDVWYSYIPAASGSARFSLSGSSYDTVLSVHSGCPGTIENQLACNDDSGGFVQSELTMEVTAGNRYLVRVSGYSGAQGSFLFHIEGPACLDCTKDCNANGILDDCDIYQGTSTDCNNNGRPDECESLEDCNNNGVQDICDLSGGVSQDCNYNGVPDECELDNDCDGNGIPDECQHGVPFSSESPVLAPIGWMVPQIYTLLSPPRAGSQVRVTVWARGDLDLLTPPCMSEYCLYTLTGITCRGFPSSAVSSAVIRRAKPNVGCRPSGLMRCWMTTR